MPTRRRRGGGNPKPTGQPGWIPNFSRNTLQNFEDEEAHQRMYDRLNRQHPGSHEIWGAFETGTISAIRKRGRAPRVQNYFSGRGSLASLFGSGSEEETTMVIPNSPDRSRLLGLPANVRENIYGFLLTDSKPVVVDPNWETLQGRVLRYNGLQYVCKQIGEEATKFLYSNNVFVAMLQETRRSSAWDKRLDPQFLSLFRNVVINCPMDNWNMEWHEKAALAVDKLADAGTFLHSLTIAVSPSRGTGPSTTAIGLEANPIHFADFFYFTGPLMTSIYRLQCKVLNIIIKHHIKTATNNGTGFTIGIKRLLISVDLTYLHAADVETNPLANRETVAIAHTNVAALEVELQNLKPRFEAIFEDYEKALSEGLCRELAEEEAITDGMALATRE
jgi:hypothetical protein